MENFDIKDCHDSKGCLRIRINYIKNSETISRDFEI